MLYLAEKLKKFDEKSNNYPFIGFSAEEIGLSNSKSFVNNPTIDLSSVNYTINMDMIGKLNAEGKLAIYETGTSPVWKSILDQVKMKSIKSIATTESGIGLSDHTSFYLKNIPVLHFFTGQHKDYHKLSADAYSINV